MTNSNIFYGKVWSKTYLRRYRDMFKNWKGTLMPPEANSGDREFLDITDDYPDPAPLINKYLKYLPDKVANQFYYSISSGYSADARLSLYKIDQKYDWHHDATPNRKHPKNSNWNRIISSITYLNDNFEGGETEFYDQFIIPKSGQTLIFPSSFVFPHRGLPIKSGVKKIIVMHIWT
tara:strand:+ start:235 stop:765 length:531 start_codon:yes stop_codon:yes gene_type:complete